MDNKLLDGVKIEVQYIYNRDGCVRPSALVAKASKPESPAHEYFEWNDGKAGKEYRLIQARQAIRLVTIKPSENAETEERLVHVPSAKVSESGSKEGEYHSPSVLITRPSEYDRALHSAIKQLKAARLAVDELRRFAEKDQSQEDSAVIAIFSRSLEMFETALDKITDKRKAA